MPHKQYMVVLSGGSERFDAAGSVGSLADFTERVAKAGFNIVAIGGADTGPGSAISVLLEPDDTAEDEARLRDLLNERYRYWVADAVHLTLPDEPGALARLARKYADAKISIDGIVILNRTGGKATISLATNNPLRAEQKAAELFSMSR
jgi:hypothetical protein